MSHPEAAGDYTVKHIDEIELTFNGMVRRAQDALGVQSFAMIVVDLPPHSDEIFPVHDHSDDGSEEVYWILSGSGEMVVDGEQIGIEPGVVVRVGPLPRRRLRSGPDGARVLMLSGVPGAVFVPRPAKRPEDFAEGSMSPRPPVA